MSTRNKVIITISSLCLVAAIIVVGVFAFATQTFSISNTISFTAEKNVSGTVTVEAKKIAGGTAFSTAVEKASAWEGGTTVNINSNTSYTHTFDGEEIQNISESLSIADPSFAHTGDKLVVIITVSNSTAVNEAFNVTLTGVNGAGTALAAESIGNGTNTGNISTAITYYDTTAFSGTASSNGASLAVSGTRVIVVVYELTSQKQNVSFTSTFGLNLATPAEQQGE